MYAFICLKVEIIRLSASMPNNNNIHVLYLLALGFKIPKLESLGSPYI